MKRVRVRTRHRLLIVATMAIAASCALSLSGSATAMQLSDDGSGTAATPSITSGKDDYAPGDLVTLTGSNWQPGESVHIYVNDDEGRTWDHSSDPDPVADDDGVFTYSFNLPDWFVATYKVQATGSSSGTAHTSFTDNVKFAALHLGSTSGPENYVFTANQVIAPAFNPDDTAYKINVIYPNLSTVQVRGCTLTSQKNSVNNNWSLDPSEPASTSQPYQFQILGYNDSSCTSPATPSGNQNQIKQFYFVKAQSFSSSALTTPKPTFAAGDSAFVTFSGLKPSNSDWSVTWKPPSGTSNCSNTASNDRPDSASDGRLPGTAGSYLQYAPEAGATGTWNLLANHDGAANTCSAFSASNAGQWTVLLRRDSTNFVELPVFSVDGAAPTVSSIDRSGSTPTNAASVSWDVTFSESVTGVDAADFSLVATGPTGASISDVTGSGTSYVVTATTGTGDGTLGLNLDDDDSIQDSATNRLGGTGAANGNLSGQVYTIDRSAPTSLIGFPVASADYNETTWSAGCLTVGGDFCGSSVDTGAAGLTKVQVSIRSDSTNQYWDGSSFSSSTEHLIDATGTTSWTQAFTFASFPASGNYTIKAHGLDSVGNLEASPSVTFAVTLNTAPTVTAVSYSDNSPKTNDIVTATPAGSDADGDTITYTYQWQKKVGGTFQDLAGETAASIDLGTASNGDKGDELRALVTPSDSVSGAGSQFTPSNTVTVANSAPSVTAVSYNNTSPATDQSVTATPIAGDADGDTLTYTYQWQKKVSGTFEDVAGETAASINLGTAGNGDKGDELRVLVTPSDGTPGSQFTPSNTLTVANSAPTADDDADSVNEDSSVDVNVLNGDGDLDGDSLTPAEISMPAHGTATLITGGAHDKWILYTPNPNYSGPDSFTYKADDGSAKSAAATVTLTVTAVNDDPDAVNDDAGSTPEDTATTIDGDDLLGNDSDLDGDDVHITGVSAPSHGTVSFDDVDNEITFTPAVNFNGTTAGFTYSIADGNGGSDSATVTLTVTAVNDDPDAVNDDAGSTPEDTATTIDGDELLGNDTDVDGDTVHITGVSAPAHGTVDFDDDDNEITFTPAVNFNGTTAGFTYSIADGNGGSDSATVTLTVTAVNDAPVAADDDNSTDEDTPVTTDVLANDTDADDDTLTIASGSLTATNGTAEIVAGGIKFTPAADKNDDNVDSDGFTVTYRATDGTDNSHLATLTISVDPVNDAPVVTLSSSTASGQYSDPIAPTITASATDAEGDAFTWSAVGMPAGLSLQTNGDGTATLIGKLDVRQDSVPATVVNDPYAVTIRAVETDPGGATGTAPLAITVTTENAVSDYIGDSYVATASSSSSIGSVNLAATVRDITAVPGDPDTDPGDIRNARVRFTVVNSSNNATVFTSSWLTPGLVTPGDSKTGTVNTVWNANIGTADAVVYSVSVDVNDAGFYGAPTTNSTVTVVKPIAGMISGGGYIMNGSDSAGLCAGSSGSKTNFGFNVKYNKNLTNLQGNMNVIVRSASSCTPGVGGPRIYQIKTNSMTALTVKSTTSPKEATFTSKANITDITDPLNPISIGGNQSLRVTMKDFGTPGTRDTIGITLHNSAGGLWFSSKWSGAATLEKLLSGGNLDVR